MKTYESKSLKLCKKIEFFLLKFIFFSMPLLPIEKCWATFNSCFMCQTELADINECFCYSCRASFHTSNSNSDRNHLSQKLQNNIDYLHKILNDKSNAKIAPTKFIDKSSHQNDDIKATRVQTSYYSKSQHASQKKSIQVVKSQYDDLIKQYNPFDKIEKISVLSSSCKQVMSRGLADKIIDSLQNFQDLILHPPKVTLNRHEIALKKIRENQLDFFMKISKYFVANEKDNIHHDESITSKQMEDKDFYTSLLWVDDKTQLPSMLAIEGCQLINISSNPNDLIYDIFELIQILQKKHHVIISIIDDSPHNSYIRFLMMNIHYDKNSYYVYMPPLGVPTKKYKEKTNKENEEKTDKENEEKTDTCVTPPYEITVIPEKEDADLSEKVFFMEDYGVIYNFLLKFIQENQRDNINFNFYTLD